MDLGFGGKKNRKRCYAKYGQPENYSLGFFNKTGRSITTVVQNQHKSWPAAPSSPPKVIAEHCEFGPSKTPSRSLSLTVGWTVYDNCIKTITKIAAFLQNLMRGHRGSCDSLEISKDFSINFLTLTSLKTFICKRYGLGNTYFLWKWVIVPRKIFRMTPHFLRELHGLILI
jgi:hypothetical protein